MAPKMHAKVQSFCFRPEMQFKLKLATPAKSNKQNSMVMLTFSIFYPK